MKINVEKVVNGVDPVMLGKFASVLPAESILALMGVIVVPEVGDKVKYEYAAGGTAVITRVDLTTASVSISYKREEIKYKNKQDGKLTIYRPKDIENYEIVKELVDDTNCISWNQI